MYDGKFFFLKRTENVDEKSTEYMKYHRKLVPKSSVFIKCEFYSPHVLIF